MPGVRSNTTKCVQRYGATSGARLFLATNRTDFDAVVSLYKQRWAAETAFGFLRSC